MTETKAVSNSLAAKIAAAAVEVGGKLKADKRNTQQNYDYISADKILSVGGQALAVQGVTIIPQVTGREIINTEYTDNYGKTKQRFDAALTMIMLITDGQSEILAPWAGFGSDYAVPDKAAYKAMTSGHKYFVMKLLSIGEGNEDGEHEEAQPAQPKPAAKRPAATGEEPPVVERQPEPVQAKPAAQAEPGKMTRETAEAILNDDNIRYGDLPNDKLSNMTIGIGKALRKSDLTPEERSEYRMKLDAIGVILKARATA